MPLRIGPYRVIRRLGKGAFGDVFEVTKEGPDFFSRRFALKLIDVGSTEMGASVKRYINEAVTGGALHHPHIVPILDFDYYQDQESERTFAYLVMDIVDGIDFAQLLLMARTDRTPIPLPMVLSLITPVCEALHFAYAEATDTHGRPLRLIHRDIKPSNLMVDKHGQVHVMDLGVAQATTNPNRTTAASISGTIPYMSPEQVQGLTLDCRSDIYSLGAVMYELVTLGKLFPQQGDRLILAVATGDISGQLTQISSATGIESLVPILNRALAPDPNDRFQSHREMANALRQLQNLYHSPITLREFILGYLQDSIKTTVERQSEPSRQVVGMTSLSSPTSRAAALEPASLDVQLESVDTGPSKGLASWSILEQDSDFNEAPGGSPSSEGRVSSVNGRANLADDSKGEPVDSDHEQDALYAAAGDNKTFADPVDTIPAARSTAPPWQWITGMLVIALVLVLILMLIR